LAGRPDGRGRPALVRPKLWPWRRKTEDREAEADDVGRPDARDDGDGRPLLHVLNADLLFCPFGRPTYLAAAVPIVSVIF
ncbi:hypothetical protein ABTM90_20520, partial [Acinetobacter baumannii]